MLISYIPRTEGQLGNPLRWRSFLEHQGWDGGSRGACSYIPDDFFLEFDHSFSFSHWLSSKHQSFFFPPATTTQFHSLSNYICPHPLTSQLLEMLYEVVPPLPPVSQVNAFAMALCPHVGVIGAPQSSNDGDLHCPPACK